MEVHRNIMTEFRTLARLFALAPLLVLAACGSGADDGDDPPPPSGGDITISGKVEFQRPPFSAVAGQGLNMSSPVTAPARQIVVEAINPSSRATIAATTTDTSGNYSLTVPQNTQMLISARAEMMASGTAPTWTFQVRNNTNGDALYVLDGSAFNSGTASSTRNLMAATGWNGTTYSGTRAAAPFAILDTVYQTKALILSAAATATFPALNLYWSPTNRSTVDPFFCTNDGDIGTTFYITANPNGNCRVNDADTGRPVQAGIYILGDYASGGGDTDEFDQHVIAHEFGHYFEDKFSRSDSIGGEHMSGQELDLRVAFGEGWGNAYSGMTLNNPVYRDSRNGVSSDFGFNIESDSGTDGWYSEMSISEILWDLFDSTNDGADQLSLGFTPIYAVMTTTQRTTDALTSIYSFAAGLRGVTDTAQTAGVNQLLTAESIAVTDAFGSGETNNGGIVAALPIYQSLDPNGTSNTVCTSNGDEFMNKLGYRRFLTLSLTGNWLMTITATGQGANADPDIVLHSGATAVTFEETGQSETITQRPLGAGTHIIEVYDYNASNGIPSCITVSATGTAQ